MEIVFLVILIVLLIAALASGYPVAFALPGSAIITIGLAALFGEIFAGDVLRCVILKIAHRPFHQAAITGDMA